MSEALKISMLSIALAACGGAPPSEGETLPRASFHPSDRASAEENLLGLGDAAFPELAPVWTAIASHPANEVGESVRVGESLAHCLRVVVVGDLVRGARRSWRRAFEEAGAECDDSREGSICQSELLPTLEIALDGEEPAALEAVAAELAIARERSISLSSCANDLPISRLASIDERLHAAGLLEPWRELHERVGASRMIELSWTRSADRGDEVAVVYRADEEALALAEDWAQRAGLSGVNDAWVRAEGALTIAIELDRTRGEVRLGVTRER
jgi:hypothetical protein